MSRIGTGCFGLADVIGYSSMAGLAVFVMIYVLFDALSVREAE